MARRLNLNLTDAAADEVDRLTKLHGVSTPDLFRMALSLVRLHSQAEQDGDAIYLFTRDGQQSQVIVPWKKG